MSDNTVEATVTLKFKQIGKGEPGAQAEDIVTQWLDEVQSISVWVESESSDDELQFDLDSFEVTEATIPA